MSSLCVYHVSSPDLPNKVLTHLEDIASTLAEQGVTFNQWQAETLIARGASREEMIAAYRAPIDRLMTERGYATLDVVSLDGGDPQNADQRRRFLEEHYYDEDQVYFFVAGRGLFNVHIGDFVYAVSCERNDLICLPAGIRHWVDFGENPYFVTIRLRGDTPEREATFTGEPSAGQFPRLDD